MYNSKRTITRKRAVRIIYQRPITSRSKSCFWCMYSCFRVI